MKYAIDDSIDSLINGFKGGSQIALSKLLTIIENDAQKRCEIYSQLHSVNKDSLILGVTGSPGVGKSSFINSIVPILSIYFSPIAIIAIDPSSARSGGAFLGDRIRFKSISNDEIFIRSVATRGHAGGLFAPIFDFINILTSFGFRLILIETVGVGQTELDITKFADITTLLLSPMNGDSIQLLKAGIIEIPDIIVVNKCDLPGAAQLIESISFLISNTRKNIIPVVGTSVLNDIGFDCYVNIILKITSSQDFEKNKKIKLKERLREHSQKVFDFLLFDSLAACECRSQSFDCLQSVSHLNPYLFAKEQFNVFCKYCAAQVNTNTICKNSIDNFK